MSETQLSAAVRSRAGDRCEYCRMHQSLQGATFHLEHVLPTSRGGLTALGNLAWCCPSCNLHKSDRTQATDPVGGQTVPLFHPRNDVWSDHFGWQGYQLAGLTPTGRATVMALQLNTRRRMLIRNAEEQFSLFPPP